MKRAAAVLVSVVMTVAFGTTAFADEIRYYINSDEVTNDINISGEGNTYVIVGTGAPTSHRIIVNGATTTITLDNVNIVTNNQSAIDIGDDAVVGLIVDGFNSLTVANGDNDAGIHISGGSLTISGTDAGEDILNVLNKSSNGATIGSSGGESFTGTITIDGGVTVNAGSMISSFSSSSDGAGIGSGKYGDMSGTITINDGSAVNACSQDYGAGIGSGESGMMSGEIIINGGAVSSYSDYYGAGIGAGDMGNEHLTGGMSGDIVINGGTVSAVSVSGTGIGTGDYGEMSGSIIINGGDVNAQAIGSDAAIGSGDGDMSGEIVINGGTVTALSGGNVGIGNSYEGQVSGDITINGNAIVSLGENNIIGSSNQSEGTIYLYQGATINGITVTNVEELKDAGILNDNMNVVFMGDETSQGHSYSLGKLSTTSRIKAAKAGDKVYVYESELSKGKLPYYVLETLSKADNVTLVLVCENGETFEINSANIPQKGRNAFFTVDELMDMTK